MTSTIVTTKGKNAFLHTNEVDMSTNKRLSTSIETIDLPRLARALLTLISSFGIYYVFQVKAGSQFSILLLQSLC